MANEFDDDDDDLDRLEDIPELVSVAVRQKIGGRICVIELDVPVDLDNPKEARACVSDALRFLNECMQDAASGSALSDPDTTVGIDDSGKIIPLRRKRRKKS